MSAAAPRARNSMPGDALDDRIASLSAEAAAHTRIFERDYTIAGLDVRMRFAGEAMLARLAGSFEHLERPSSTSTPALTINIWDSASSDSEAPLVLGQQLEEDEAGPIYYYDQDGVRAISRWRTLSVFNAAAGEAWFWTPSPAEMLSWDWAAPLRAILHWWLGGHGIVQVHGGAIGTREGGALVVGRGGSGKSTTALACLEAGLCYAGDDFVGIETRPDPHVHSLYCTGKLESHHLDRFPGLLAAVANPERLGKEKAILYVQRSRPGAATPGFPLQAVLIPRIIAKDSETRLVPAPAPTALAALAPSTIFQLHPPQPGALTEMAALVRRIPSFWLDLGRDIDRIPAAILELLEKGR
jgi:hypothetical protein